MSIWEKIAKDRISTATATGKFNNLTNQGKPLNLDADENILADLQLAYRILKNAGLIPAAITIQREIIALYQQYHHYPHSIEVVRTADPLATIGRCQNAAHKSVGYMTFLAGDSKLSAAIFCN
jgi:hypothetical protein